MNKSESWDVVSKKFSEMWNEDIDFADEKLFSEFIDEAKFKQDFLLNANSKYGTPMYVLDEEAQHSEVKNFCDAFIKYYNNIKFFYAFKCNDLPAIIQLMKKNNVNADVAGMFELQLALKLGFNKIIFTSPGKTDDELLLAMKNSDKVVINMDSIDELNRVINLYTQNLHRNTDVADTAQLRVSFRINMHNGRWSKFGLLLHELKQASEIINAHDFIEWHGIHFHSSWNDTPEKYLESLKTLHDYLSKNYAAEELKNIKFIDIGGGFTPDGSADLFSETDKGTMMGLLISEDSSDYDTKIFKKPYKTEKSTVEEYASTICPLFENLFIKDLGLDLELWIEPGRMLVSKSTHILLKVIALKDNNIIVDGGINMIGGYDFDHTAFPVINISNPSSKINHSTIYGPLCDPNDIWGTNYYGEKAKVGDIILVMHQGAYTYATAWKFIKPISKYVGFKKDSVRLLKKEETFDDRYNACKFE